VNHPFLTEVASRFIVALWSISTGITSRDFHSSPPLIPTLTDEDFPARKLKYFSYLITIPPPKIM